MELIHHLRGVRVLCALDASGSFTAAARELGLTQSAVSQHVSALERHLQLTLVDRASRPTALTEAGHTLARHGRLLLSRLADAEHELAEVTGRRAGRLRLGSFPTALATFVPPALARFRDQRPGVRLSLVDDHLQALLPRLYDGELDVALVYDDPALAQHPDVRLDQVVLFDDPFRVVLPERHRLAGGKTPLDLTALRGETWIGGLPGSTWFSIVRAACRGAGFEPDVGFASDDYRGVQAFVAAGLGVAVVPGLAVAAARVPGTSIRRLRAGGPSRRVLAVRPPDAYPTPASLLMLETLASVTASFRVPARR
ncbi:LysR family transcriptional regulator [Nocardioides halotolerans]|uniref:LysR family transcriptional regulator n=1 Tax=Nocardioides halotolerans TaxID=433660 RepID=UPI0004019B01|nr:LysR family transcriptional regulator [Nocardioides halotolerans]